jgi:CAAX protease family protein
MKKKKRYGGASVSVNRSSACPARAKMLLSTVMHWDFALILLFLGVVVPWLGRRRIRQLLELPQTTKMDRLTLYASTIAFQWLAAFVVLWRTSVHGIPAARLGLAIPRPQLTMVASLVLAALFLASQLASLRRLVAQPAEIQGIVPQLALKIFPQDNLERLIFFALVSTVALCEELIYRGFVQLICESMFGGLIVAGIIGSAAMFALAHLYQGRRGLVTTSIVGLLFSTIRALTGSLLAPMVAHFVADLTVGLVAPGRLRTALALRTEGEPKQVIPNVLYML